MEDTVVFLTWKLFNSDNLFIASFKQEMRKSLSQRTHKWNKEFSFEQKHRSLINTWSNKVLKGTVVNQELSSFYGGSLEINFKETLYVVFNDPSNKDYQT